MLQQRCRNAGSHACCELVGQVDAVRASFGSVNDVEKQRLMAKYKPTLRLEIKIVEMEQLIEAVGPRASASYEHGNRESRQETLAHRSLTAMHVTGTVEPDQNPMGEMCTRSTAMQSRSRANSSVNFDYK